MMIGERTDYDSNLTALDAILAEWASGHTYATRISNILSGSTTGYALNGHVHDDGVANTMTGPGGASAARNWFITITNKNPADNITKRSTETISYL
jgi:hypothetical protein